MWRTFPVPSGDGLLRILARSATTLDVSRPDVHSRYGVSARRVAKRPVCLEGWVCFPPLVASKSYRLEANQLPGGIAPTEDQHLYTAQESGVPETGLGQGWRGLWLSIGVLWELRDRIL
jgi:hypothetical protein